MSPDAPSSPWRAAFVRRWSPHVVLFALALTVRTAWVLAVRRTGFAFNDAIMYHTTAQSLRLGDGYVPLTGGPTARWPPGYSTLLGAIYSSFGVHPTLGELANALLGALTVVALMLVVEDALDRATAIVAGVILAVLPGPILWTDVLVAETAYTALFVGFVALVLRARPSWGWAIGLGAAIGVGALFRGEALTWVLLPTVLWRGGLPWRAVLSRISVVVAATAVVLSPWTIRNAVVMDAFVPVATNASQTLWSGHHPGATGAQTYPPDGFEDEFSPELPERELEASAALRDDAIEYMLTHPLRELQLIPLKLIHLNRGDSYALDWVNAPGVGQEPPLSPIVAERVGVIADVGYFGLLATTIVGGCWLGRAFWRRPIGRLAATSFLTALVLYGFVYYGNYRYRLPYEPLMVVVAATFGREIWRLRPSVGAHQEFTPRRGLSHRGDG